MKVNLCFTIIIILIFTNKTVSECICTENKGHARCTHYDLNAMQARHNQVEKTVIINIDAHHTLPDNALPITNLQQIKLRCNIKKLKSNTFTNQTNLKDLDLSGNSISTIPNDLFAPTPMLSNLNLSHNTLQNPTLDTFYALDNLKTLDISHNSIAIIPLGTLDEMIKLKQLYLNNNEIRELELGVFDELKSLTILDLSYNYIFKIVLGLFDQSENLLQVNLAGNNFIGEVPLGTYDNLKKVTDLSLSDCKIEIFDEIVQLTKLDLSKNEILKLPSGIFSQNTQLTELNLSGNKLRTLPGDLFRLTKGFMYLNLSYNLIQDLPIEIFQYTNLTEIDISYNQFTTIKPDLLNMETLEKVYAQNNQISYLDELTFATSNFPLKYLDVRNNRLVFLGESFFEWVAKLVKMEIFGNPWDCSCLDNLLEWLTNRSINYTTSDYYEGKIAVCVIGDTDECNIDKNNLSYYYTTYKMY